MKMNQILMQFLILMGAVVGLTCQTAEAADLELAGSTTIQKRVLEPASQTIETATGVKLVLRGINTGRGFEELRDGKIKASMASSPLALVLGKAGLPNDGVYQEHIIMQDVIVPIVNAGNPVSQLTWQQLSDINTGKITNWKEVGGADQKIVVITSQPTAATREVFQDLVMKKAAYVADAREVQSTRMEVDMVSKFAGGIGAVSEGFVSQNPGKIKVVKTDTISRPLSLFTKGAPDPDVKKVIDFLLTDAAKKLFQ